MKYDKLEDQRLQRQQGLSAVFGAQAAASAPSVETREPARRQRASVPDSKRTSWKMRAWYVQPETASRLRAYVNRQQESGLSVDASDVVDQAIREWLDSKAPKRQGA